MPKAKAFLKDFSYDIFVSYGRMDDESLEGGEGWVSYVPFRVLYDSPGLEDLWQLHWSYNVGLDNRPAMFIANVDDNATVADVLAATAQQAPRGGGVATASHSPAYLIKVSAERDGTFTVTNTRNGFSKTYKSRP